MIQKKIVRLVPTLSAVLSLLLSAGCGSSSAPSADGASPAQSPASSTSSVAQSQAGSPAASSAGSTSSAPQEVQALALLPEGGWESPVPATPDSKGEAGTLAGVYIPKYAKGFTVEYYLGGARILATNIQATASTSAFSQRVLILPEGAAEPKDAAYDKKIDGYLSRAVTLASSHAGHFSNLNAVETVKGTSINTESCYIPALKTALESGGAQYVGSGDKADKELIASLEPQIVFVGGMQSDVELARKLEESGIFCLYFGDFAEEHYMGRAQWIELIGALIGKEQPAQDFMKDNETAINAVIARAAKQETRPSVLWFTHSSQAPHFNVRTDKDYVNSMVSAVGGTLLFPDVAAENSIRLSNEDFLPLMLKADRIVFGVSLNSYKTAEEITFFNKEGQIDFAKSNAYQSGGCYVVGYDWAQDTANARSIMESIAAALYPDEFADLTEKGKVIPFQK